MTVILALDIGKRRTGVAFYDSATAVPLPLDTIAHHSTEELLMHVAVLCKERKIDRIIVGLPLLLSGMEGEQSSFVRSVSEGLEALAPVTFLDERYSTPRDRDSDPDAAAACGILTTFVDRKEME
ncbi:MAG: Holliday junction resolvase RuvX [Candidatus Peribacteraceae bacterium]|nr:Holliday junction resolvase RuvX [Candidatus Peribacteraceae bacterium]MDD5074333.1 Holliday junction resolvase RuvX [Candidatus Peribacteraceae bacterium]